MRQAKWSEPSTTMTNFVQPAPNSDCVKMMAQAMMTIPGARSLRTEAVTAMTSGTDERRPANVSGMVNATTPKMPNKMMAIFADSKAYLSARLGSF